SLLGLSPFLFAIITSGARRNEREILLRRGGRVTLVPQIVMHIVGSLIALVFMVLLLVGVFSNLVVLMVAVGTFLLMVLVLSPLLYKRLRSVEQRFLSNINERENRRTGRENNLVSDLHLAYMTVGYSCPFVGERLKNADIRRKYGVNVASIQRNTVLYPVPKSDMRIFPGDVLGVIGTEDQIQQMLPLVEANETQAAQAQLETEFTHFILTESSPLVGKKLSEANLHENYSSLLVAVQRDDEYFTPSPDFTFLAGDTIWIVGDKQQLETLR
ncbi:MAG: TrkA C-terminal domain-containing protein, partial [Muribaculaceae bacterium]|nr:TrkA C-terminal domain-containing protein [Muribaculaceae bacterium]